MSGSQPEDRGSSPRGGISESARAVPYTFGNATQPNLPNNSVVAIGHQRTMIFLGQRLLAHC
jgi:hypothetical protein